MSFLFDVSSVYVGEEERWWFEVLATRGSARLAPLRVIKELNGRPTDVSPDRGGGAGERVHPVVPRRAGAFSRGRARRDRVRGGRRIRSTLHKAVEAIYKSAEEGKEVRL